MFKKVLFFFFMELTIILKLFNNRILSINILLDLISALFSLIFPCFFLIVFNIPFTVNSLIFL